jgi:outer membrane protein
MKRILSISLLGAFTCLSWGAELKVATVDVQRLTAEYYKSQEVLKQLKEKESSFLKELEGLRLEGRKLAKQVEDLKEESALNVLSAAERESKKKSFEVKLLDLSAFQVRYDDVRAQREAELQAQLARSNKAIQEEVLSVTRYIGEREGFNLILNANKASPLAGDVIFSRNVDDITEKALASLNATKVVPVNRGN